MMKKLLIAFILLFYAPMVHANSNPITSYAGLQSTQTFSGANTFLGQGTYAGFNNFLSNTQFSNFTAWNFTSGDVLSYYNSIPFIIQSTATAAGGFSPDIGIGQGVLANVPYGDLGNDACFGYQACHNVPGYPIIDNVGIGNFALQLSTGTENTAVGDHALVNVTGGNNNTTVGSSAMSNIAEGNFNSCLGVSCMQNAVGSLNDSCIGTSCLNVDIATSGYNSSFGSQSLFKTQASFNTAGGMQSGYNNISGTENVWFGYQAGAGATSSNLNNSGCIGYQCSETSSNTFQMGGSVGSGNEWNVHSTTFTADRALFLPTLSPEVLYVNGSGQVQSGAVALTSQVTGILPLANGGTNNTTGVPSAAIGSLGFANTSLYGVQGSTTNDNAPAGDFGEYVSSTVANTNITLGTTTPGNACSIFLSSGDWQVGGAVSYAFNTSTTVTFIAQGASSSSGALPGVNFYSITTYTNVTGVAPTIPIPEQRFSLSAATRVYLVADAAFGISSATAGGQIWARRVR